VQINTQLKTRNTCGLQGFMPKSYITLLLQVIKSSRVTLESSGYIPGSSSFPTDETTLDGMLQNNNYCCNNLLTLWLRWIIMCWSLLHFSLSCYKCDIPILFYVPASYLASPPWSPQWSLINHHILCCLRIILQNKYHATRSHVGSSFLVVFVHSDVAICCSFRLYILTILRCASKKKKFFVILLSWFWKAPLYTCSPFSILLKFSVVWWVVIKISIQWFPCVRFLLNDSQALKYHKKSQNVA